MTPARTQPRRAPGALLSNAATLLGGLVVFFSVPLRADESTAAVARNGIVAALGVTLVGWVAVRQSRGSGRRALSVPQLVMLAEVAVCAFALIYYSLAIHGSGQLVGVHTRLDALYFTMTTMTTVGYGDVHASGQVARAVVCVHLAFNLVFLGLLANLVRRRLVAEQD
ncbi:potassium channel family protein [Nocardioides sp.]|uniref:potassium channel family protein n=1 Tax=Nocardioides sp. TaxID=35761 RepID=UPI001A1EF3E4|nr:potassium channel family protein [Nocardioides sp.]MBJ7357816.1 two pore domain potassium channel family protein [Nocardioides sp.]